MILREINALFGNFLRGVGVVRIFVILRVIFLSDVIIKEVKYVQENLRRGEWEDFNIFKISSFYELNYFIFKLTHYQMYLSNELISRQIASGQLVSMFREA